MRVFVLLLFLLVPAVARAADPPTPSVSALPPGEDVVVVVRRGEAAPFAGQLFDDASAIRWANYILQYRALLQLNTQYQKQLYAADADYYNKKIDLLQAEYRTVTADLQKRLLEAQKENADPPFYRTTWFGIGLGVAGSAAAVVLAVMALHAAQ